MKNTKPLWRLSVATSFEAEDAVAELLTTLTGGAVSSYFNLETGVSLVHLFSEKGFPPDLSPQITARLKQIKSYGLDIGPGTVRIAHIKREDWAESWKKHFKAFEVGRSLLVKPSWIQRRPRPGQAVVVLDPGLSFGTGQHPTTSFCLSEIVRGEKKGTSRSFLDIGTGSGILAIAAAKLNYQPVRAFDFDPESVRVAKANAKSNHVQSKIRLTRDDVTKLPLKPAERFDLVCANLISNLLMAEKQRITSQLKPDGTLVLAGILAAEFTQVQKAFAACGLKLVSSKTENEWRSGAFQFSL
jgi:ribosomal protein L11 methyltransferase